MGLLSVSIFARILYLLRPSVLWETNVCSEISQFGLLLQLSEYDFRILRTLIPSRLLDNSLKITKSSNEPFVMDKRTSSSRHFP